ncbi:FAD-binding protein [Sediminicoccus sp. KRV36]|uniref:FAD-binding protein n=1 Tax=Sediminicoccus sp. KRV36 TaxID=3133721 RepID=UPI0020103642|nr:FAD-binding protein [Sediminicoccus rosea]UPY35700.1 FAD-binding protein [Sediminicoccus rosea]
MTHLEADVLIIGAGGAGMYAAIEAARSGAQRVLLLDRSLIGRGGATVMAQMTVAAAVGQGDHWEHHLADTLTAARGLADPGLAALLCEVGAECILEMDQWRVGWARSGDGFAAVQAPGHDRARCVYVDFLNTGPAVSRTLRAQVQRVGPAIRRVGEIAVTDLVVQDGAVTGAAALHVATGEAVTIAAPATIIATGGLTRLYARNSASANMSGDGYALALRAGATLVDMEFVQFFPIGHLAPRLIGMDPIMWDPFRYKLGGRLLNGAMEDFLPRWGGDAEAGRYSTTRDLATYAITKENEAGRGSPHGGAWLSFTHLSEAELRAAFGPVVDKLAANGIDLTRDCVEVAPIAHYHMGGIRVDRAMRTDLPGLLAAGEAVGGANGANRLSGNAITEALAFGRIAGREAARLAATGPMRGFAAGAALDLLRASGPPMNTAAMVAALQRLMSRDVGPFRTAAGLQRAAAGIAALQAECGSVPPGPPDQPHDLARLDWFDLRQMLLVARAVVEAALAREESRGAHQREDFPQTQPAWQVNQLTRGEALRLTRAAVPA